MMNVRLYLGALVLFLVFIYFQYHLWFQPGGISDMLRTKQRLAQQIAINEKLKRRNEVLMQHIQHMQNSQDAAEMRARTELGMIKKGEIFYQIVDGPSDNDNRL